MLSAFAPLIITKLTYERDDILTRLLLEKTELESDFSTQTKMSADISRSLEEMQKRCEALEANARVWENRYKVLEDEYNKVRKNLETLKSKSETLEKGEQ